MAYGEMLWSSVKSSDEVPFHSPFLPAGWLHHPWLCS